MTVGKIIGFQCVGMLLAGLALVLALSNTVNHSTAIMVATFGVIIAIFWLGFLFGQEYGPEGDRS